MSEYYLTRSDELYHYGVKGQQWGNRQYQNADGSLTELGRQHYGYGPARQKMLDARAAYRNASRISTKSGIQYSNRASNPFANITKNQRAKTNALRDKAYSDYENELKARDKYKNAKSAYKNSDEHKARVKKAIKIGAAVAGTALAAYGVYKVSQIVRNKRALSSGQNLAATAKFQETLSKRYNDVIGNMNGRNSDTAKNYFNKNQALKSNLARTQSNLQAQNAANATNKMKSSLANAYNNVVGNMNGRDADKAKRYYDARKALTAPAERAAANSARVQKLRDAASNARNSASSAYNNARNAASSAYGNAKSAVRNNSTLQTLNATRKIAGQNARNSASSAYNNAKSAYNSLNTAAKTAAKNATNAVLSGSDRKKLASARSEISPLLTKIRYYEGRLNAPGLDSESKITAARELNKVMNEAKSIQNTINSITKRRG